MHGFSSDEDEDEALPGKSSNGVCPDSNPLPKMQPRAKENDPPAKRSGVSDVNSTTENHCPKQEPPSMVLQFQESAYAKLGDLEDMFDDDDDDDDNIV